MVLPGIVSVKPDSLTRSGAAVLRLRVADKIDRLERALGRPFANRSLPLDVRVREVDGWLSLEDEVAILEQSEWSPPDEEGVARVLELLARALI